MEAENKYHYFVLAPTRLAVEVWANRKMIPRLHVTLVRQVNQLYGRKLSDPKVRIVDLGPPYPVSPREMVERKEILSYIRSLGVSVEKAQLEVYDHD